MSINIFSGDEQTRFVMVMLPSYLLLGVYNNVVQSFTNACKKKNLRPKTAS